MKKKSNPKEIIEFRRDMVSGEWILVSSVRRTRPLFLGKSLPRARLPKKDCPFDDPQKSGNPPPILWYPRPPKNKNKRASTRFKDWFIQIIPNKYPVLRHSGVCPKFNRYGPYKRAEGFGSHEVIITRDHNRDFEKMSLDEISLVFRAFQERYRSLEKETCIEYILIFHNRGSLAGASIGHPHSQLVALPIIPPDVSRSINGGLAFFEKNKKCVHCVMLDWEIKEKTRIVYENEHFITLVPYASRVPYEMRIFPRKHSSDFEEMPEKEARFLAESLKDALIRLDKVFKNPAYNFFIHTASARVKNVPYYHWHIEILPRTYEWAGLELGTGVEVISAPPEEAADNLRKAGGRKK